MIYKLQNAGSLPRWMQKLNSWSIPNSDESAGERILNSTIKQANNASTQEERNLIYKDSAKKNLAVTGQSLMMLPMLGEFTTYGLLGGGLRLGAGMAGSKAVEYVLGKGGDWADKKLNTKFLGTTGRIIGGLGGWWGGSSATTPLFRNLAGKGITLHIPQETFMNLRGQYFDRAAKNIKLDATTLPKLQYRDRLMKDYLEFGPDTNIYGDNVSKLVHWDPMTTGTKSALPINGGFNRDPIYFPHFENGKLVAAVGQIRSKLGNAQMYEHPYHPIFFGGNKPWWETPGSNFSDQYLKETTFNKSKFAGPKQYYDRWAKTEKQNLRNLRNWYTKYGPQNKSDRYLITDPENLADYEFSYKLGIMGSEVPMSKLEGFEYDPLLGTFKRARYTDPSTAIVSPQEAATTYHFDGKIPLSRQHLFKKQGGIIKGQNGFLNTWQKAYNSKFGKDLRDFMFGKDRDLSDEEYLEKYGYNKPVGGLGPLVEMTTIGPVSDFSGVSNIVKGTFGNGGVKANVGLQNLNTEKRALQLLKSYDEELKRDRVALEWAGKKWNELTNTEKYWLKVRQGHQWNDKLIVPRNM